MKGNNWKNSKNKQTKLIQSSFSFFLRFSSGSSAQFDLFLTLCLESSCSPEHEPPVCWQGAVIFHCCMKALDGWRQWTILITGSASILLLSLSVKLFTPKRPLAAGLVFTSRINQGQIVHPYATFSSWPGVHIKNQSGSNCRIPILCFITPTSTFFKILFTTVLSQWDFSHGKFGLPSTEKASCNRVSLPYLWCMLGVLVFP